MKLPDLSVAADAGVHEWFGAPDAVKAAATAAKLKFCQVDLQGIGGKADLLAALGKCLSLPSHFGKNWDALASKMATGWAGMAWRSCFVTPAHTARRMPPIGRRCPTR